MAGTREGTTIRYRLSDMLSDVDVARRAYVMVESRMDGRPVEVDAA